ncbi:GNAT family N-acetyltransferase [Vibrio sp. OCN044]|uniref:GNAT family N-acetyltransferase n=1 Tax=Vibrio tetraodonis subsp. pristinus TaxID=2695891 RepID=A0A6L8LRD1_9VIBR|nr:GNAT family N-acetyltransferase [Vibrio tetraodonis]MYM58335.1 GNAT family N-acetyltransferase [Vibrio tetraodonis subsp. pristinus]
MTTNNTSCNVSISPLDSTHLIDVQNITLADEQEKYAGNAENFLSSGSETMHLYVIKSGSKPVGFFKIDTLYSDNFSFCSQNSLGVKAFAIDINCQGKGIGTLAVKALLSYLDVNYSQYKSVYLTVNCKNPAAKACYHKGGFLDTQQLYLGGEAGPQHIMYADIGNR